MILRSITPKISQLSSMYPVLAITGPRQSGKTTLSKQIFPDYLYLNLENLDLLETARSDPRSFLRLGSKQKLIIDEVQKYPDLLSYIQVEVDINQISAQFIITGSQQFNMSEKISQSLAGRVANFTLLPLSLAEIDNAGIPASDPQKLMHDGFYPRIYDKLIPPKEYYRDYLLTYVERDIRQIKNVGDLSSFQRFLQLIAGRVGQVLNRSSLANDTGVNSKTIESWLSILEASFIIFRLQPYFKNYGKRVIKNPKIYFYDTGLLCYLLGIDSTQELNRHFAVGQIFENLIIADTQKKLFNTRSSHKLYFFRDSNGNEVDLLIDKGVQWAAVEIKAGKTFSSDMLKGLNYWQQLSDQAASSHLVYTGDLQQNIANNHIVNWKNYCLSPLDPT